MIGEFVGKILDATAAKHDAETWERNFNRLLQEKAALQGENARLKKELDEKNAQVAEYRMAADGDTRRLVAENSSYRQKALRLFDQGKDLQAAMEAEVTARKTAENALALTKIAPVGDPSTREAEQHKANALRLSDALCELRESTEQQIAAMDEELAALRGQLDKCGREHRR